MTPVKSIIMVCVIVALAFYCASDMSRFSLAADKVGYVRAAIHGQSDGPVITIELGTMFFTQESQTYIQVKKEDNDLTLDLVIIDNNMVPRQGRSILKARLREGFSNTSNQYGKAYSLILKPIAIRAFGDSEFKASDILYSAHGIPLTQEDQSVYRFARGCCGKIMNNAFRLGIYLNVEDGVALSQNTSASYTIQFTLQEKDEVMGDDYTDGP